MEDEPEDNGDPDYSIVVPGFSANEVAEQVALYLAEVDADYNASLDPLADAIADAPPG